MLRLLRLPADEDIEVAVFYLDWFKDVFLAYLLEINHTYIRNKQKNLKVFSADGYMFINPHIADIDRRSEKQGEVYSVCFAVNYRNEHKQGHFSGTTQTIYQYFASHVEDKYCSEEIYIKTFELNKNFIYAHNPQYNAAH